MGTERGSFTKQVFFSRAQTDTLMSILRGCKIILTIICAYGNRDIYSYMRQQEVQNITLDIAAPNESNHEEI